MLRPRRPAPAVQHGWRLAWRCRPRLGGTPPETATSAGRPAREVRYRLSTRLSASMADAPRGRGWRKLVTAERLTCRFEPPTPHDEGGFRPGPPLEVGKRLHQVRAG